VISIVPPALASAQSSTLDGRVVGVPLSDPWVLAVIATPAEIERNP